MLDLMSPLTGPALCTGMTQSVTAEITVVRLVTSIELTKNRTVKERNNMTRRDKRYKERGRTSGDNGI